MKLKTLILAAILITIFMAPAYAQEMPAPGTIIDKANYKKYAHLFPEEFLAAFETGWGLLQPIKIKVAPQTPVVGHPKAFLALSAKNKGKFQIDAQGNIPGFTRTVGLPFPDLDKSDKDFATKVMWNFDNRYKSDEQKDNGRGGSWEKRKGEAARVSVAESIVGFFTNRIAGDPKPNLHNPIGLYTSMVFHYILPNSVKNTITLAYRYADVKKTDDTYLYLPALRRVLRAESGQRSTPMLGSTQALDDFNCFDGRTPDFTYTLVKEQKILTIADDKSSYTIGSSWKPKGELFFISDGWEMRDTYVIDIRPKDPRYPQSRKRIWIDKESFNPYFSVAYDRAGKLWKLWFTSRKTYSLPNGEKFVMPNSQFGIDTQFGLATNFEFDLEVNNLKLTYNDFTPAALLTRAR